MDKQVRQYKSRYAELLKILEIVVDGDRTDPLARQVRETLTVQDVLNIKSELLAMQDMGVQLLQDKN